MYTLFHSSRRFFFRAEVGRSRVMQLRKIITIPINEIARDLYKNVGVVPLDFSPFTEALIHAESKLRLNSAIILRH